MIAFVKGVLENVTTDNAIIDVNGFGISVMISSVTAGKLPSAGSEVKLFTHMAVKEDDVSLYGFLNYSELELFKKLISVNGIGPKGALSILSLMDVDSLIFAIHSGDVKTLSKAQGIGVRTAERLVVDLKGKIELSSVEISPEDMSVEGNSNAAISEAIAVLVEWGYSQTDSARAIKNIDADISNMDSGKILKLALKNLTR